MQPELVADAARRRAAGFAEQLALHADAIADALARELHLVAWDREQLIGSVQERFAALRDRPPAIRRIAEPGVASVVEWREQPLEAVDAVWSLLLAGRAVRLQLAPGACSATRTLMRELVASLPAGALVVDDVSWRPGDAVPAAVARAVPRVAAIDASADRELAAYVLARTCLRRAGTDPRAVHRAFVVGGVDLLQRHLQRLWVGAQLGPADDPSSFAGPVDAGTRDAFVVAQAAWLAEPRASTWVEGGVLERADDPGPYLAPAAFAVDWPAPTHELVGPMCCIVRCTAEQARAEIEAADRDGAQIVHIGGRPLGHAKDVRDVRGAVLVERLPPGLPEPRPV